MLQLDRSNAAAPWTLIPGSWCLDRGYWARSLGCYVKHNILCCSGQYRAAANTTSCAAARCSKHNILCLWCLIPGAWSLVPGPWSLDRGSWCMVHGSWFLDRGYWTVLMLQHPEPWSLVLGDWIAAIGPDPWSVMQNTTSCAVVVDIELQQTQHLVFMVHDPWSLVHGPDRTPHTPRTPFICYVSADG